MLERVLLSAGPAAEAARRLGHRCDALVGPPPPALAALMRSLRRPVLRSAELLPRRRRRARPRGPFGPIPACCSRRCGRSTADRAVMQDFSWDDAKSLCDGGGGRKLAARRREARRQPATISRRVEALEAWIGEPLLSAARGLRLTQRGEGILSALEQMRVAADASAAPPPRGRWRRCGELHRLHGPRHRPAPGRAGGGDGPD
jgi:hypothetical protein